VINTDRGGGRAEHQDHFQEIAGAGGPIEQLLHAATRLEQLACKVKFQKLFYNPKLGSIIGVISS
jgi:hypothetical protein